MKLLKRSEVKDVSGGDFCSSAGAFIGGAIGVAAGNFIGTPLGAAAGGAVGVLTANPGVAVVGVVGGGAIGGIGGSFIGGTIGAGIGDVAGTAFCSWWNSPSTPNGGYWDNGGSYSSSTGVPETSPHE